MFTASKFVVDEAKPGAASIVRTTVVAAVSEPEVPVMVTL